MHIYKKCLQMRRIYFLPHFLSQCVTETSRFSNYNARRVNWKYNFFGQIRNLSVSSCQYQKIIYLCQMFRANKLHSNMCVRYFEYQSPHLHLSSPLFAISSSYIFWFASYRLFSLFKIRRRKQSLNNSCSLGIYYCRLDGVFFFSSSTVRNKLCPDYLYLLSVSSSQL